MRTDRIVQRQTQRTELTALKEFVKTSRPLMEADKQLRRAYMAGYKKRLQEEVEEAKAKKLALECAVDPAQVDAEIDKELSQELGQSEYIAAVQDVPTDEKEQIRDVLQTKYPDIDVAEGPASPEALPEQALCPGQEPKDSGSAEPNQ